ncbi:hypothetical protein F5Y00DRAFT_256434 [Daldinia vernicosa]|uniref:uncharacterized protein n=1 Tax=Daldinia vernicosa TaxID=114800 RepID=UPI002008E3D1|nr:uncharacterized protein F5Y00DRAFT_256434 [Daldinia vernicosa]KAI0843907.1 hypothetical protein F5Y00DRAFT_256434 [Daldinia vernicosa]
MYQTDELGCSQETSRKRQASNRVTKKRSSMISFSTDANCLASPGPKGGRTVETWADQDLGSQSYQRDQGNPAPRIHVNHLGSTEIRRVGRQAGKRPSFDSRSAKRFIVLLMGKHSSRRRIIKLDGGFVT